MKAKAIFHRDCSGDLGISVDGRVVAQLFQMNKGFNVWDLVAGGAPSWFAELPHALIRMEELAWDYSQRKSRGEVPR